MSLPQKNIQNAGNFKKHTLIDYTSYFIFEAVMAKNHRHYVEIHKLERKTEESGFKCVLKTKLNRRSSQLTGVRHTEKCQIVVYDNLAIFMEGIYYLILLVLKDV